MPSSLIAAETALSLLVVYFAIRLGHSIRLGTFDIPTLLNLAWTAVAVIGIPFGSYLAWRFACAASAFIGILGVLGGMTFLFLSLTGHDECGQFVLWSFSIALYLFMVFYLLNRPTTASYFKAENDKAMKVTRGTLIALMIPIAVLMLLFVLGFILAGYDLFWQLF